MHIELNTDIVLGACNKFIEVQMQIQADEAADLCEICISNDRNTIRVPKEEALILKKYLIRQY